MSTENLEHEDQNRTPEPTIDIRSNEAPADPEQEIVSQGVHNYSAAETYVCPTDPAVLQQLESVCSEFSERYRTALGINVHKHISARYLKTHAAAAVV